jgi:hypothetical protein
MAKQKRKIPTFTSPIGTLVYPFLIKARDYKGDEKFAYSTKLVLTGEEAAAFEKFVDEQLEIAKADHGTKKVANCPYDEHKDDDDNVIEGATAFKFKVAARTETKNGTWDRRPAIFDSAGTPIVPLPRIGSGTQARVSFQVYRWKNPSGAGVTLQPVAVQVIRLVEFGGNSRTADEYGFGAVEGGFVTEGASEAGDSEAGADEPRGSDF